MFFDLVRRNSRRSRKENGIFFSSLLVSIVAFYIVLSLSQQDIMAFLGQMESDAVNRLLQMVPLLYLVSLFLLFFLVYFASKYQLERRSHEFGIYLTMGMRRSRLFLMLLAEDIWSSLLSLGIGLPTALLLSEMVSLVTARLVGIGILGHQSAFSIHAAIWTVAGFLGIKLLAFAILSGKISHMEIGGMLAPIPENAKPQNPARFHKAALLLGVLCLGVAYGLAIWGMSWTSLHFMGFTLSLGLSGTFLLFYGMRAVLGSLAKNSGKRQGLSVFTFRQLQENVICQSHSMAVSSLLALAALCCFGFGVATAWHRGGLEAHVLDYTFQSEYEDVDVESILEKNGLRGLFQDLFQMKAGYIQLGDPASSFEMAQATSLLREMPASQERDALLQNLSYVDSPHIISLSGYNHLLAIAGEEMVKLEPGQAGVYMDTEFAAGQKLMDQMLGQGPEVHLAGESFRLSGKTQSVNLVVDRSITLSFALIVRDEDFERLTDGAYDIYWNGVLRADTVQQQGLLKAMMEINQSLGHTSLTYESYLQNIGRQLFYQVAASYVTLYLAFIFLVIANTVLGVQFLMRQQKTGRRYQTLARLGSSCHGLYGSAKKQIRWHFGIPIGVAVASAFFGVWSLFTGLLPVRMRGDIGGMLCVAFGTVILLGVVEWAYLSAVTRASRRHILKLMEPEREE